MSFSKEDMVEKDLKGRDIKDPRVLEALQSVDRSLFVPEELEPYAWENRPLPIGQSQTISQPYIVAFMAQELGLEGHERVLEIGSGCGYNAAVLSRLAAEVYSIEIIGWLAELARKNIALTDCKNIHLTHGDGYQGWSDEAPFDAIVLTAAPKEVPKPLKQQLREGGGRLLAPVGDYVQQLVLIRRQSRNEFSVESRIPVTFVPMTGEAERAASR